VEEHKRIKLVRMLPWRTHLGGQLQTTLGLWEIQGIGRRHCQCPYIYGRALAKFLASTRKEYMLYKEYNIKVLVVTLYYIYYLLDGLRLVYQYIYTNAPLCYFCYYLLLI
jgi:hypothetical protein